MYQDPPQYNDKRRFGTMTTVRRAQRLRSLPSVTEIFLSEKPESPQSLPSRQSQGLAATKKFVTGSVEDLSNIDNDKGSAG